MNKNPDVLGLIILQNYETVRNIMSLLFSRNYVFSLVCCCFLLPVACQKELPFYPIKADFTLKDDTENKFVFHDSMSKKITLLFFGFTRCPTVCPQTLKRIEKVSRMVGTKRNILQTFMVSVDPEYDSPRILKQYLESYKINVRGLWGSGSQIKKVMQQFGASIMSLSTVPNHTHLKHGSSASVNPHHSSHIFLIDKKGRVRSFFRQEDSPQKIATAIRGL